MTYEQEKKIALNHALVSSKLKIIIKMFDKECPADALNDLRYALELFKRKAQENRTTAYY